MPDEIRPVTTHSHQWESDVDDATCRVCGGWPSDAPHLAALSLKDLNAATIRTGCETEMNRAADREMQRRGYRFDANQQRWQQPTPDADRARLIEKLRKQSVAIYIAVEQSVADDIAATLRQAADLLAAEDDEPDITVGGEPWTEEQLAAVREIARQGDLKHAKKLLEQNGYIVALPSPPGGDR